MTLTEWRALWRADREANRDYAKSRFVLYLFRGAQYWRSKRGPARVVYAVVGGFYKVVSEWILGIEIPASTRVGPGLRLRHGVGVVVNPRSVIGAGVMLRHGVTLGNRRDREDCPVIEDAVELGAGATVIGSIRVGAHSRIAPGVLVTDDVPAWSVVLPPHPVVRPRKDAPAPSAEGAPPAG